MNRAHRTNFDYGMPDLDSRVITAISAEEGFRV